MPKSTMPLGSSVAFVQNRLRQYGTKKQHERGAHGPGWKAPCGKKCQWPGKLSRHKSGCSKCQDSLQKQKLKHDHLATKIAGLERKKK